MVTIIINVVTCFDDCLSNIVCLLELCAGDDEADEDEDLDGFWCLALGDDVHSRREFSLLVVFIRIGDGSGEGNMIFFFIFGGDSLSGDKGDTGKSIFFDYGVLFLGDGLRNTGDKFESESSLSSLLLGAFDVANKKDSYLLNIYADH